MCVLHVYLYKKKTIYILYIILYMNINIYIYIYIHICVCMQHAVLAVRAAHAVRAVLYYIGLDPDRFDAIDRILFCGLVDLFCVLLHFC